MKDAEDEAFDELAKRQGHWGGGFMAKKAMAADKLRDCIHGSLARSCQICDLEAEVKELKAALAQPAQEPVARVSGVYGGRFTYDPINPAMILPIGMALYATPQHTATWVGLTDEERQDIALEVPMDAVFITEAKLKEKNNG